MTRSSLLSLGLVALVALSGCSVVEAQRYPNSRRGGEVYRPADYRTDRYDRRYDRGGDVRRDVREYVRFLDRELGLSERQEFRVAEILENRTEKLLRERGRYARDVYPFPRSLRNDRYRNRDVAYFWRDADSRIERVLNRGQVNEYRQITDGRRDRRARDRYRYDEHYRYDDRYNERYDDRRYRDRDDDDDDDRRRRRGRDRDDD